MLPTPSTPLPMPCSICPPGEGGWLDWVRTAADPQPAPRSLLPPMLAMLAMVPSVVRGILTAPVAIAAASGTTWGLARVPPMITGTARLARSTAVA